MGNYDIIKYCPSLEATIDKLIKVFGLLVISVIVGDGQKIIHLSQSLISHIEKFDYSNHTAVQYSAKKKWQLHHLFSVFAILLELIGNDGASDKVIFQDKAQAITHLSHIVHQIQKGEN